MRACNTTEESRAKKGELVTAILNINIGRGNTFVVNKRKPNELYDR